MLKGTFSLLRLQNAEPFLARANKKVEMMTDEIRAQDINNDVDMFALGMLKNRVCTVYFQMTHYKGLCACVCVCTESYM